MSEIWSVFPPDRPPPRKLASALAAGILWLAASAALALIVFPDLKMVPYALLAPAVAVAALLGGAWPGFMVTVPVLGISLALQLANGEEASLALVRMALSAVLAVALCLIAEAYHQAWDRAAVRERELRLREAYLQTVVETVPEAIITFAGDGTIVSFNPAAETMFGLHAPQALGSNIAALFPEAAGPWLAGAYRPGERFGEARAVYGRHAGGETFPISVHLAALKGSARNLTTLFGIDLTPLRKAALREDDLRRQLTHAWRLNSMGEMAGALSHEINQPLAANLTYLAAAQDLLTAPAADPDKLQSIVALAAAQTRRASEIIRRLRLFVERSDSEQRPDRICDLLAEVEPLLRIAADGGAAELDIQQHPDVPGIWADRVQIQQVIMNLVRNAVEALSGCARRRICIETANRENWAIISVSDSGPGISTAMLDRLMEPFAGDKPAGMGLGLSISKSIMEAHGGYIRATAGTLGGACFEIGLPAYPVPGRAA